ncbi:MAG TPA: glyoxalase/bleomycin resistance/extradiol dioxygenase family protein [Caulobacteraceae bacterium]|nr:glyoxalase/bleomycin resistance/extradiol dioxygenase family protein [Caulobacteraceae bacterium]
MAVQTKAAPTQDALTRGVIPYIQVEGASDAVAFYQRAFGARERSRSLAGDGKRLMNCQLEINGGLLMVMDAMPEHGFPFQPTHSITLQLLVPDGQAWFDRAVNAGCTVTTPFQKMFWGDLWGAVTDPFAIHWGIDQPAAPQ